MRFHLRPGVRRLFRLPLRTTRAIRDDVDDELEAVVGARVDALVERGFSADDARAAALVHLGTSLDEARRQLHHSAEYRERRMRFSEFVESVWQDTRYAARGLARRRGFTAVAVATLAIGVGGTTAIFSAVDALLLRPLPYPRPDELMKVSLVTPPRPNMPSMDDMVWSYPKFRVFRDAQQVFRDLALYSGWQATITSGDVERMSIEYVGASYLRTLGLAPIRGRDFDRAIDTPATARNEAILSYALWQRRFDADPSIVGKTLDVDRKPYTIIGVAPQGFGGLTGHAQFFLPVTTLAASDLEEPQSHSFRLVARLAPGVSPEQAQVATRALGVRVNDAYPNRFDKAKWGARAPALDDARLAPAIRRSLLVLFGAVALVLLIACVNVANLLLGRASTRRREMAVRVAIGAGRRRLVRLLLTESTLLALAGAAASIAVAWAGVRALGLIDPATTLRIHGDSGVGAVAFSSIALDWRALAFALGVSLAVGLLFGLVPALGSTRASLSDALKTDGRTGGSAGASLGRRALVVAEVTLALVLLAGSGLMLRSLTKLLATDPGFDARNVLTFRLALAPGEVARDSMPGIYAELLDRVRAVPGVTDAAINNCAPLSGGCNVTSLELLDRPAQPDPSKQPLVGVHWASPSWFQTMSVRLDRGRVFTAADRIGTQKVTVVNDAAASRFWPDTNPLGKMVSIGQGGMDSALVVGVVRGVRQNPDSAPLPEVYVPYAQSPRSGMIMFVRSPRNVSTLGPEVRHAVHGVAPQLPMFDMQTMDARAAGATAQARFRALLLALFAATALALAAVGIYGVMSLSVTSRWRELGIRAALGADRARMLRLVVGEGLSLVAVGAAIGLIGALAATRVLSAFLFGVSADDPVTYTLVTLLLVVAAALASWIPARRAARVEPVEALRAD
ncbi:MAG: ADOP family duplicated permease [Gemmatimonadales bacterium]